MEIQYLDFPGVTLACLRHTGPYGAAVGRFWESRLLPWLAAHQLEGLPCFGLGLDDPCQTSPEQCRYDAGVAIDATAALPEGAHRLILPPGRYATRGFTGTAEEIGAAWDHLFSHWLPASGEHPGAQPSFEWYPATQPAALTPGTFTCVLYLALR